MELLQSLKNISQLEVGQTLSSNGEIQDTSTWSTTLTRTWYGEGHTRTCSFLKSKVEEAIEHVELNQTYKEEILEILPKIETALSNYRQTCMTKWYASDVNNQITPLILRITSLLQYRQLMIEASSDSLPAVPAVPEVPEVPSDSLPLVPKVPSTTKSEEVQQEWWDKINDEKFDLTNPGWDDIMDELPEIHNSAESPAAITVQEPELSQSELSTGEVVIDMSEICENLPVPSPQVEVPEKLSSPLVTQEVEVKKSENEGSERSSKGQEESQPGQKDRGLRIPIPTFGFGIKKRTPKNADPQDQVISRPPGIDIDKFCVPQAGPINYVTDSDSEEESELKKSRLRRGISFRSQPVQNGLAHWYRSSCTLFDSHEQAGLGCCWIM